MAIITKEQEVRQIYDHQIHAEYKMVGQKRGETKQQFFVWAVFVLFEEKQKIK